MIAEVEGEEVSWFSAWLLARGLGTGWLIMAVWTAFGVACAVLSRGTALAIGIGILYRLTTRKLSGRSTSQFFGVIRPITGFRADERSAGNDP